MDQGNQERKSELGEVVKMKDSKILDLQFVVMDDIVFKNIPFEDRINTKLTLSDWAMVSINIYWRKNFTSLPRNIQIKHMV